MKKTLCTMLFALLAVCANAVPAKPDTYRVLTLTDGTTVTALLVGDEFGHFWRGADGKVYREVPGTDLYAEIEEEEEEVVIQDADQQRSEANSRRSMGLGPRRAIGTVTNTTGEKKGLIILVNFNDVKFQGDDATTNTLWNNIVNKKDFHDLAYKAEGNDRSKDIYFHGSVYDYFLAQSDGAFKLSFDVVGPVTLSQDMDYYGGNNASGNDQRPREMVYEALGKVNDSAIDFTKYDWDNDGSVDQVYVIYAGKGEADGGSANTIWPHQWQLSGKYPTLPVFDGKTVNKYACSAELDGSLDVPGGVGTICHEFSHCLGYTDTYDIDYSGGQGMGRWDLMSSGNYNGNGYTPAGYTSYQRWMAGWKTPTELTATTAISSMKALQDVGSDTYIIYNPGNRNEYFLLENRQKTGWDEKLPGAGLLILHVDYNAAIWNNNQPNDDPLHQRLTWIPADNEYQYTINSSGSKRYLISGMATDCFPYTPEGATNPVNWFSASSTPAAKLYNRNTDGTFFLDSSVDGITQNANGTISFTFAKGSAPAGNGYNNLSLDDASDNTTVINSNNGQTFNVTLSGRTLWKDGGWNTLCLPFDLDADQVTTLLAPTELKVLDVTSTESDGTTKKTRLDGTTLYLEFANATTISAGKPYIIRWNGNGGDNLVDPTFSSVTIKNGSPASVAFSGGSFKGTYGYTQYKAKDKSILFVGDSNTLYYPQPDTSNPDKPKYPGIGAFRANFKLDQTTAVRSFVLSFTEEANGIRTFAKETGSQGVEGAWYTLGGQKLNQQPTKPGLYIYGNKKIMVK